MWCHWWLSWDKVGRINSHKLVWTSISHWSWPGTRSLLCDVVLCADSGVSWDESEATIAQPAPSQCRDLQQLPLDQDWRQYHHLGVWIFLGSHSSWKHWQQELGANTLTRNLDSRPEQRKVFGLGPVKYSWSLSHTGLNCAGPLTH